MSDDALLGPREIREIAASLGIEPQKRLGQNFVVDPNTVRRIVSLAEVASNDVVLEIGPGIGSLTLALLPHAAAVVAVEIDGRLADRLGRTVAEFQPTHVDRLTVIEADALHADLSGVDPTILVANLPYNVSVPVVIRVFSELPTVSRGLVMVQLEVARRLAADRGTPDYGVPSVKMQWFGNVDVVGRVSPQVFWPVPRVDSGLVRIVRTAPPESIAGRSEVFACIDAGFSQRRKKLRSALSTWAGSLAAADEVLAAAQIDPAARAENLTLVDFVRIADARLGSR